MKKICLIVGIGVLFGFIWTQKGAGDDEIFERKLVVGEEVVAKGNSSHTGVGGDRIFKNRPLRVRAKHTPGEIIVKFKPGVGEDVIDELNSRHDTSVFYTSPFAGFRRLRIPRNKTVAEMVEIYKKNPAVDYAELNYIAYTCWVPNDPFYSYQWHLDNHDYGGIQMEDAWELLGAPGTPGENVIVAVVDTGVAYEDYKEKGQRYYIAPDLEDTDFVPGYDFVNDDEHANDDNSHGTHVTGTIAQSANNGIGVAGVAFNCSIMPVKVLDREGSGYNSWVADGIYFAVDNGAHVINLSLGGSDSSTTLENAVAYAYDNGVTVIAAAGNAGSSTILYPAAYDSYVIAVGATQYDESLAPYSNYGSSLDLVAPGGNVDLDQNGDGKADGVLQNTFNPITRRTKDFAYWFFDGTSMAAPHVSGVAALLIAYGNAVTPAEVRAALQDTAEDLGDTGRDDIFGYGLVDAYAALSYTPVWEIYFQGWESGEPGSYSMYDGWFSKYYYTISPTYDLIVIVDDPVHSGDFSQKVMRVDAASNYLSPLIEVTAGERYRVSAWINWVSGGWPFVGVSRYNEYERPIGLPLYDPYTAPRLIWLIGKGDYHTREGYEPEGDLVTPVPIVDGWNYYEKVFTVPEGTAYVRIMTELWKGASRDDDNNNDEPLAYFDDIAMHAIAPGSSYEQ